MPGINPSPAGGPHVRHHPTPHTPTRLKATHPPPVWAHLPANRLGKSGQSIEGRPGFQRLLAEVALDHVGLILGLEMSRLARCCKDWHQLLELCGRYRVLLADADGIYDPTEYSDRLLLGLHGVMNEAELHVLKQRMYQLDFCNDT